MKFQPGNFYHIYNRGNDKQKIFFTPANYEYFRKKIANELANNCNLIGYCLMPNHFHLLVHVDETHTGYINAQPMQYLDRKIGSLQSSYTRAINKQEGRTGSLFHPKAKVVEFTDHLFASYCFHYIHQNPLKARLTSNLEDWRHSSFREYFDRIDGICKKAVAYQLLKIQQDGQDFYKQSVAIINNAEISVLLESRE